MNQQFTFQIKQERYLLFSSSIETVQLFRTIIFNLNLESWRLSIINVFAHPPLKPHQLIFLWNNGKFLALYLKWMLEVFNIWKKNWRQWEGCTLLDILASTWFHLINLYFFRPFFNSHDDDNWEYEQCSNDTGLVVSQVSRKLIK